HRDGARRRLDGGGRRARADRPGALRRLLPARGAEAVRARGGAAALVLVSRGVEGLHADRPGRSRLRDGVLGPGHDQLDADLVAAAGRGAKRGGEAVDRAKAAGARTPRERDFVAAAEAFFKDADTIDHRTRALAYGR